MVLHSEFRDGNVPAGFGQLRVLKEALVCLPAEVKKVFLRSDTAGYQKDLLAYCAEGNDPRFDVIEFAISADVTKSFRKAVAELQEKDWQRYYHEEADGSRTETTQEWAEVCFVLSWAGKSKKQADYRFLAIRKKMTPSKSGEDIASLDLPFQTLQTGGNDYKLFGLVTNRTLPGNELIQWHRARCGKSKQVHSTQKTGLAGGQFPSAYFGSNAAWWQIMILAYNLNRLMQLTALPASLKESQMKALRFHFIQLPGRVIHHARQYWLHVAAPAYELLQQVRKGIAQLAIPPPVMNTS